MSKIKEVFGKVKADTKEVMSFRPVAILIYVALFGTLLNTTMTLAVRTSTDDTSKLKWSLTEDKEAIDREYQAKTDALIEAKKQEAVASANSNRSAVQRDSSGALINSTPELLAMTEEVRAKWIAALPPQMTYLNDEQRKNFVQTNYANDPATLAEFKKIGY